MKSKEAVINDIMHDYNNTVKNWLKTRINGAWDNGYLHGRDDAMKEILCNSGTETVDASDADVEERKRGKWIRTSHRFGYGYKCSICGSVYHRHKGKLNFCPNCGVEMSMEANE